MDTRTILAELAIKEFGCDPDKIAPAASIAELGIDSIGLLEFIFRIEDIFGIEVDNAQAANLKSLSDIAALVDQLRASTVQ
ncbi:acyl carrier protein [Noviherbaspirillum sp.]|uniref:acyl carrier protein n=1 Tax=Noviherbaspirillum sp. TaxID=1926288 RepID=UPI002B4A59CD|nr:acyl carrier protein [Noviherbaspirillum sp.]HJV79829.1 acyl carrier protein [Noviherbaspirillum sp.]